MASPNLGEGLGSSQAHPLAAVQGKIQINLETGFIKLPNGKTYKVKVTSSTGTRELGKDQSEITNMVIELLNRSQAEEKFTFKDLSKTKITHKGISTDQAKKAPLPMKKRVITPANFSQSFEQITRLATGIMARTPVAHPHPIPSVAHSEEEIPRVIDPEAQAPAERRPPSTMAPFPDDEESEFSDLFGGDEELVAPTATASLAAQTKHLDDEEEGLPEETEQRSIPVGALADEEEALADEDSFWTTDVKDLPPELTMRVKPLDDAAAEEKPIKDKALPTISKVGNGFKEAGHKIRDGWNFVAGKIVSFFSGKKEAPREEGADASVTFEKPLGSLQDSLREGELQLAFEEVVEPETDKKAKFATPYNWLNVSLQEVNHLLAMVVDKNLKLAIVDGKLSVQKRGKHLLKSQIGKSPESQEIVKNIIGKIHENLIASELLIRQGHARGSREEILKASQMINSIHEAMGSLKESEWASRVIGKSADLQQQIGRLEQFLERNEALLKQTTESEDWKYVSEQKFTSLLLSPLEAKFRRDYLTNYRLFKTSEQLLEPLVHQFKGYGALLAKFEAEPADEEGNITLDAGDGPIKMNRDETIRNLKVLQRGILLLCSEWLEDPFINCGDHLKEGSKIPALMAELGTAAKNAAHIPAEAVDSFEELVAKIGSASQPQLSAPKKVEDADYSGYSERLIALAAGKMSTAERDQLLEDMSNDFFKLDSYFFSQLTSAEFNHQAWNKGGKEVNSPNIMKLTEIFNRISDLITISVVGMTSLDGSEEDSQLENRARMLEFFIDLGSKAVENNDFHQLEAIYSGLSNSAIGRLQKTWAAVSPSHKEKLEALKVLGHPEKNFINLRTKVDDLRSRPGEVYVPYLGSFLKDYTFIEDGNQKFKGEDTPKYVTPTLEMLGNLLEAIAEPKRRILERAEQDESSFALEADLLGELTRIYERAPAVLDKVAAERGASFAPRLVVMKDQLSEGKKLDDILYAETLAIEPRPKT